MLVSCSSVSEPQSSDPQPTGSEPSGPQSPEASASANEPLASPSGQSPAQDDPNTQLSLDFDDIIDTRVDDTFVNRPDYVNEARVSMPEISGNMLVNPGFEDGLNGWTQQPWNARITMESNEEIVRSGNRSLLMTVTDYVDPSYPNIHQAFPVNEGDSIRAGVWARTFGCTGGVGAYAVISYTDSRGNRIAFESSVWSMNTAVSEWIFLTVAGVAPEGCVSIAFQVLLNGYGEAAFDDAFLIIEPEVEYEGTHVTMPVRPLAAVDNFLGFGAQGDMFLTTYTAFSKGIREDDIDRLKEYIGEMRIHNVRLFFSYKWWEDKRGVRHDPFLDKDLKNFIELVQIYNEYGVEVNVCPWGDVFAYGKWQVSPDGNRAPPDDAIVHTAESLAALLKYLIVDLGLNNVKYVTLANEPDNTPITMFNTYRFKKSIKALDWALSNEGIRDRVGIIGSDDSSAPMFASNTWFRRATDPDVIRYCDFVASHTYSHWLSTISLLTEWIGDRTGILKQKSPDREVSLMITEYGYGYDPGTNEKYLYGLSIADFAVEAVNNGVVLLSHWSLADTYYDAYTFSRWGLIRFKTEDWSARPPWYSYSLLTRYTGIGDKIYAFESPDGCKLRASLFLDNDGKASIAVTNTGDEMKTVELVTSGLTDRELFLYIYSEDMLPDNNHMIKASGKVNVSNDRVTIDIPGQSVIMLSER